MSSAAMKIAKAVLTAAGRGQRTLPLQNIVDRDGVSKSILRVLCDEAAAAGIEEVAIVIRPDDEASYANAIGDATIATRFVAQREPLGYGHALAAARDFVAGEPFLHLVSDHLFVHSGTVSCAKQLVAVAEREEATVSAVQATHERMLPQFGTVGARRVRGSSDLYEVQCVLEKPTPTEAEHSLHVPGLRAGNYLCFLGMHVLTNEVLEWIARRIDADGPSGVDLTAALDALTRSERYLAFEVDGRRFDLADKYGLFAAQLALGLAGTDHDAVLEQVSEVLLQRERRR